MSRLTITLLMILACSGQNTNPLAADPKAAETGRWMFRIYCAPCHGIRAEGGRGPDLTRGTYEVGDLDKDLFGVIAKGVTGSEMQGYADHFDTDGIWRLVSYIRSVARRDTATVEGDVAGGEKLFWGKGGCGKCHVASNRGTGIGPDLSRVGRRRSLAYLRASVVTPDADVTPGYGTIRVVMRDGRSVVGVERNLDNFSAQLIDLSGKYYSFAREDVTSITREARSQMPSYQRLFTPGELNDLLAYLSSLRGAR